MGSQRVDRTEQLSLSYLNKHQTKRHNGKQKDTRYRSVFSVVYLKIHLRFFDGQNREKSRGNLKVEFCSESNRSLEPPRKILSFQIVRHPLKGVLLFVY